MEAARAERDQHGRISARTMGVNANNPRATVSQVQTTGSEAEILMLPVDMRGHSQALQDPVTGQPYFMAGVSEAGGPDAAAG